MGTWNYRIVHYREGGYGLHEVHYDDSGKPYAMTDRPVGFVADEPEGPKSIHAQMLTARVDAIRRPVIEEAEIVPLKRRRKRA